ncbi:MAG: hypothetical protein J6K25_14350 [Thermoguttaceae bacterium]|nr:hypothetical protein [Thermoguttaceae bacterium]
MSEKNYSYRLPYSFRRRHFCSYCGAVYEYPISGEAAGTSQKSEAEARVEAEKMLKNVRERTALDKPCPNCGRYSSETLACFSVGDADGTIFAPVFGGVAAAIASTPLLTVDANLWTLLLATATCAAVACFAVASWNRLKRLNATPGENLAATANDVKLRSDLIDIRTNLAWGREVDKSTFQWLEYFRLARLVFPAFAVLYFFGCATGAVEGELGVESVRQFWFAIIGTAVVLAVLEGRAGSEENRFQGKKPLALNGSEIKEAAATEPLDETAPDDASLGDEARSVANWTDAALETGFFGASAENADVASRPELSDEREEAVDRAFAALGGRDESLGTEEIAFKQEQTLAAPPTNRVAPVAVEETPDETEVAERERAERERVERERAERERAERERVERERSAALVEVERARKAEELEEKKRLGKYDASPERLSKYDR